MILYFNKFASLANFVKLKLAKMSRFTASPYTYVSVVSSLSTPCDCQYAILRRSAAAGICSLLLNASRLHLSASRENVNNLYVPCSRRYYLMTSHLRECSLFMLVKMKEGHFFFEPSRG